MAKADRLKKSAATKETELHNDTQLWQDLQHGDPQALEKLFHHHYSILYDYGVKLTRQKELVKDGIQELFAYIWEKHERLADAKSIRAYLLVSLRRQLLLALAKQHQRTSVQEEFGVDQFEDIFTAEDLIIFAEKEKNEREAFKKAFNQIPARLREALYLRTYDSLTYKEIAEIMNVTLQVARNYVSEALQHFRKLMRPNS